MRARTSLMSIAAIAAIYAASAAGQPQGQGEEDPLPQGHPQIPVPQVGVDWPEAAPEDVESIDAILNAFYEAPAGAPDEPREWDRFRSLFVPSARLIPARQGADGTAGALFLPVSDYIEANKTYFEKGGFWDTEIARTTESFGIIVHVWSTFESRRKSEDTTPYVRGINSIQLLKDVDRYWIVGVYWDFERPGEPIPPEYLPAQ